MRHGSLFSGIGGFDLAAEWMGWENVFHCEWNTFGQKILKYYWPNAKSYEDITKSDFTIHRGEIDILTGGFPCQPYSLAGKRLGKNDERHLWPSMLRAIREIQPRWVVGENVFGLVNWSGGLVFHQVQADLEAEGYEVQSYVLPAAAVNAPHRRDRIWFVAYNNGFIRGKRRNAEPTKQPRYGESILPITTERTTPHPNGNGFNECNREHELNTSEGRVDALSNADKSIADGNVTDTNSIRLEHGKVGTEMGAGQIEMGREGNESSNATETDGEIQYTPDTNGIRLRGESNGIGKSRFFGKNDKANDWQGFPTVSPVCHGDDGLSNRLDNITFSKWRNESIKGAGNAIVPQVVYEIFKAIESYEHLQITH